MFSRCLKAVLRFLYIILADAPRVQYTRRRPRYRLKSKSNKQAAKEISVLAQPTPDMPIGLSDGTKVAEPIFQITELEDEDTTLTPILASEVYASASSQLIAVVGSSAEDTSRKYSIEPSCT